MPITRSGITGDPDTQRETPHANQYFLTAAQCGSPYAQVELGLNYEFGHGVPRNRP